MNSNPNNLPDKLRLLTEHPLSLKEAAQELPKQVATSTIYRWALRGVRGHKLETVKIGAQLITSREAITRFLNAINTPSRAAERPITDTVPKVPWRSASVGKPRSQTSPEPP